MGNNMSMSVSATTHTQENEFQRGWKAAKDKDETTSFVLKYLRSGIATAIAGLLSIPGLVFDGRRYVLSTGAAAASRVYQRNFSPPITTPQPPHGLENVEDETVSNLRYECDSTPPPSDRKMRASAYPVFLYNEETLEKYFK